MAQANVPEKAAILAMADHASLLHQRRNPVLTLDFPGFVSPAPGIPLFDQEPEKVAAYLEGLGLRYFVFIESSDSADVYRRETWTRHASGTHPALSVMAPPFLATFRWID